jgi:acyl-CoA thioester hydrolase
MNTNITFRFSTPIQVRFTDVDMMAHVTNSMYLVYADMGRMKYLNDVLGEQIRQNKESLVIASLTIDFKTPIFLAEKIEVLSKTVKIGNKSIQMLQHIINAETNEIKAVIHSSISGFNYIDQKAIIIPERWKKKLARHDTDVKYKYNS